MHRVKCVEFATIITYHYVNQVTYGLPVSQIETTSLNCEEAIKKPLISQRLIIRLHILNASTTFNVIFISSTDVLSPTLCGLFLFNYPPLLFNFPYCFFCRELILPSDSFYSPHLSIHNTAHGFIVNHQCFF